MNKLQILLLLLTPEQPQTQSPNITATTTLCLYSLCNSVVVVVDDGDKVDGDGGRWSSGCVKQQMLMMDWNYLLELTALDLWESVE